MRFTDIPGLASIKEKLIQSIQNGKMAHAQLLAGKEGALNLPLALAYATYLHCENRGDEDACGQCRACSKSLKYIHPDTHFVFPWNAKGDKDADRAKAESMKMWRTFLMEQPFGKIADWSAFYGAENKTPLISKEESREIIKALSLKSFESPFKVMLIWLPEYMHSSAANGILKILEEPPPQTFFLLVSNTLEKLMGTLVSRTQKIQVPLLSDDALDAYLKQHTKLTPEERTPILQLADGDLNMAMRLIEDQEHVDQEHFATWMRACFKRDYALLVAMADQFHQIDKMNQHQVLLYGLSMLRESLLSRAGSTLIIRSKGSNLKFVQDFGKVVDVMKIEKTAHLISEASYHLERNGSAKMIFLNLSLKLAKLLNPG